jgi:membrane protein YqaA with SNARE-associated domain
VPSIADLARRLRAWASLRRIELKYTAIAAVLLGGIGALSQLGVFGDLDENLVDSLDATKGLGAIGMFLVAFVSNCMVLVQIPYTLPLLAAAISGASLTDMVVLGVAAGVGAGFGEIVKYHIAHRVLGRKKDLHRSRLFQWVLRQAEEKPKHVKWIVFVWAGSVLPDDTVVIPLAMVKYGVRRIAIPLFAGKVLHNVVFSLIFYGFSETAESLVDGGVHVDVAFAIIAMFLLIVLYQVEKALHEGGAVVEPDATVPTEPATDGATTD